VPRQQPRLSAGDVVRLFRLLGDQGRLRMLLLLAGRGEVSVGDLAGAVGRSQATASVQLGLLRWAGVVASRREGRRVYYRLNSPLAADLLRRVGGG
jgi:DNA-binding transcriptional ArsR family regulator